MKGGGGGGVGVKFDPLPPPPQKKLPSKSPVLLGLTTTISKNKPREFHYRNYKKFDSLKFKIDIDLKNAFSREKIESCIKFEEIFMNVLNRQIVHKKTDERYIE